MDVVSFTSPSKIVRTKENMELEDHCTGLVKIHEEELYCSQVAWFTLGSMTRVTKQYTFDLNA